MCGAGAPPADTFLLNDALGGVVRVDPHILGGEVGGEKPYRVTPAPKLHTNIADRLPQNVMRLSLVERAGNAIAAYFLFANVDLNPAGDDGRTRPSDSRKDASPIRISACPCGFDEHGVGNCPRDQQRFFPAARLFNKKTDDVLHAFPVADDLFGERLAHSVQSTGKLFSRARIFQPNAA